MRLYNALPKSNFGFQYPGAQNSLQNRIFNGTTQSSSVSIPSVQLPSFQTPNQTVSSQDLPNTTASKQGTSKFGSWVNKNSDIVTGASSMIGSAIEAGADEKHSYDQSQNAVRDAQIELAGKIPVVGGAVQAGLSVLNTTDKILQKAGLAPTNVNQQSANRAGVGGSAKFNKAMGYMIGSGPIGLLMGKVAKANDATEMTNKYANSFNSSMKDYTAAKDLSGARMFNAAKASKFVNSWNAQNRMITAIGMESELAKNNSAWQLYDQQNFNKYNGYSPNLLLARDGIKFPELEKVRTLIKLWSPKSIETIELQKFQLGGKMNLLPSGALHARKHNLGDVDPELEGQITNKGIPVITKSEDGICQTAEIEKEEWVIRKEFTEELETLYKLYQENKSDEVAIKAGKLICHELLVNTDDQAKLIKKVK